MPKNQVKVVLDVDDKGTVKIANFGKTGKTSLGKVDSEARRLAHTFKALGGVMAGAFAGRAIAEMGIKISRIGADFEHTMRQTKGIARATDAEFQQLTNTARAMGESTEWSASQAGEALKYLSMAGFDVQQSTAALPGTLDLATAGGIELGRAADIASNALSAMALDVSELGRVNDVFIATTTRSNTDIEMMAESFKYAAPSAQAFGYSVEDLSAYIGVLGNAGIQGSMAGTGLAKSFQCVSKVFDHYGASALNADGSSKNLADAVQLLKEKNAGAQEVMDLFGDRAGKTALVLMESLPAYRSLSTELHNSQGEAKSLADEMRDDVTGSCKQFKSVMESIALDTFDKYRGGLKMTIDETTTWLQANKDLIQLKLAEWISGAITGFVYVAQAVGKVSLAFKLAQAGAQIMAEGITAALSALIRKMADMIGGLEKIPMIGEKFGGMADKLNGVADGLGYFSDVYHDAADETIEGAYAQQQAIENLTDKVNTWKDNFKTACQEVVEANRNKNDQIEIDNAEHQGTDITMSNEYWDSLFDMNNARHQRDKDLDKNLADSAEDSNQKQVNARRTATSQLTSINANFRAVTGKENKTLFLLQQGIAAASAIMNGRAGAVAALAPPPIGFGPVKGAAMAPLITAGGYANAALIMAQSVVGQAHDGLDRVPATGTYVLKKDEMVASPAAAHALSDAVAAGALQQSSGPVSCSVHITAVDAQSFVELAERNPRAITGPVIEALAVGDRSLIGALREAI